MKHLNNSLPILASMLGRRHNVEVRFSGKTAYTDGKRINLPLLDSDDPEAGALLLGYLVHEAGHIRHTDFSALDGVKSALQKNIANILEDVWLENKTADLYPGSRNTLRELVETLYSRGYLRPPGRQANPAQVLLHYMRVELRSKVLHQSILSDAAATGARDVKSVFGEPVLSHLNAVMFSVTQSMSSHDNMALAARIVKLLEEERDRDSGQNDADNQPGSDEGESDASNGDGETPQGGVESQNADGDNPTDQDGESSNGDAGNAESGDADRERNTQAIQEALETDQVSDQLADAMKKEIRTEVKRSPRGTEPGAKSASYNIYAPVNRARARAATVRLSLRLRQLLESQAQTPKRHSNKGRRLNRRLDRVCYQDPRLFTRSRTTSTPNTAIHILLDRSSSMREEDKRMELASETTLSVMEALRTVSHVAARADAFPGVRGNPVTPITGFTESIRGTLDRYGILPDGGTPLLPALWHSAQELFERPEKRKMLLVVTDAEPANSNGCRRMMERMEAAGIECLGLGIKTDGKGAAIFPVWNEVHNIEQLPQALFGALQEYIQAA